VKVEAWHTRGGLTRYQMQRVNDYIERHISTSMTTQTLAAIVCLSRHHFSRLFRATTGTSPGAYLRRARLRKAKAMMENPALTLGEIAYACGFADQSHLNRVFRQYEGTSPSRWLTARGIPQVEGQAGNQR
jgi:AraC family transcriptional regulator